MNVPILEYVIERIWRFAGAVSDRHVRCLIYERVEV